jgi:hypothetical protein
MQNGREIWNSERLESREDRVTNSSSKRIREVKLDTAGVYEVRCNKRASETTHDYKYSYRNGNARLLLKYL